MEPRLSVVLVLLALVSPILGVKSPSKSAVDLQYEKLAASNPAFSTALAEVESQINTAMGLHDKVDEAVHAAAVSQVLGKKDDKKASAEANVNLKNSLDIKTMKVQIKPHEAKKQPAHVISAFVSVAWEAVQRGKHAVAATKHIITHATYARKIEKHDLFAWLQNQKNAALARIKHEQGRIARVGEEVSHLQHVYRDAVAKASSYKQQISALVTERQLQSTPPIMPSVRAATLSEKQYKDTIKKLEHYLNLAKQIMQQTSAGIAKRDHLISQGLDWVKRSQAALKTWEVKQRKIIGTRLAARGKHLTLLKLRLANYETITTDATKALKAYKQALKRANYANRAKVLAQQKKHYEKVKPGNKYDKAHMEAFLKSIDVELAALKSKIDKIGGDGKVRAPPAAWGVLAGFSVPLVAAYPKQAHTPVSNPPVVTLGKMPHFGAAANKAATPAMAAAMAAASPKAAATKAAAPKVAAQAKFRALEYGKASQKVHTETHASSSVPPALPSLTDNEMGTKHQVHFSKAPPPPSMPDLPGPPDPALAKLAQLQDNATPR